MKRRRRAVSWTACGALAAVVGYLALGVVQELRAAAALRRLSRGREELATVGKPIRIHEGVIFTADGEVHDWPPDTPEDWAAFWMDFEERD